MATDSYDNTMRRYGIVYFGTADSEATTPVGLQSRATPPEVTGSRRGSDFYVDRYDLPIDSDESFENVICRAGIYQIEPALLALALGFDASGQSMNFDEDSTYNRVSVKVVGARADGTAVTFKANNCKITGDFTSRFSPEEMTEIPLEFKVLSPTGSETSEYAYQYYLGSGTDDVTLATGVLTRTAPFHIVNAESGTSDTLDSIGGDLSDGDTLRLQPASGDTITLTHLNSTLELWNDSNWIMDSAYDWIDLQYVAASTKWIETQRFDYSVSQS